MQSSQIQICSVNETNGFRVYPQRFWVLFIFVFLAFNQSMFGLTFSPIVEHAKEFYHITETTVDLLLNWGPIIFLPTLPLNYFLLNTHHGLRKCMLMFAIVTLLATLVRLIPLIITSPSNPHFHDIAIPFLHLGQILNAAMGPAAMGVVSQLSCIWFAPHERTRATTVAIVGVSLGGALEFLISPLLVTETWRVPHLLYMHAGQAILACILTLAYFPAEPLTPPSVAAHMLINHRSSTERPIETLRRFLRDILHCCRNVSCVLLIISGALMGGAFPAWTGLFATILVPLGHTQIEAGWFGFSQSVAIIAGSLLIGFIADRPRFQRSFKLLILVSLSFCFIFCLFFQLSVRTVLWPTSAPLPSSSASIGVLLTICGFFFGAALPLFYECLVEMMHPLPESLSTSILVLWFNAVTLIFLAIAPNRYKLMNLLVLLMIGISIIVVACARFTYRRKDEELRKKVEQEFDITQYSVEEQKQKEAVNIQKPFSLLL